MLTITLVALIGVLLSTVVILVTAMRRGQSKQRRALASELEARQRSEEISYLEALKQHDRWVQHTASLQTSFDAELERVRAWASMGLRWEGGSRDLIVTAAERHRLEGFIATNICFKGSDSRSSYVHQIDHLLVSQWGMMIIESKRWNGLIFHGKGSSPDTVSQQVTRFGPLVNLAEHERYVIHVKESEAPTVLRGDKSRDPVKQVRAQAAALANHLRAQGLSEVPYIRTCVFYSHDRSILIGGSFNDAGTSVVDLAGLEAALVVKRDRLNPEILRGLASWARVHGADIMGLGAYREEWRSLFPDLRSLEESRLCPPDSGTAIS